MTVGRLKTSTQFSYVGWLITHVEMMMSWAVTAFEAKNP
jgi:hypothetical protein